MAKLVSASCPNCGAALSLAPLQNSVECGYCNITSLVEVGRPAPPPSGPPSSAAPRVIYVDRPRSRWPLIVALALVAAVPIGIIWSSPSAQSPVGESDGFTGEWTIASASNPGSGVSYQGQVRVHKAGERYDVSWTIPNTTPFQGVGLAYGEGATEGGGLVVGWSRGAQYRVAVYDIGGGRLDGRWATESSGSVPGAEVLVGPANLSGTFDIELGKNPDGTQYDGTVTIEPRGQTYFMRWTLSGVRPSEHVGVGIRQGDRLIVGWGASGNESGVVAYEYRQGALEGTWATPGGRALGTEVLTR